MSASSSNDDEAPTKPARRRQRALRCDAEGVWVISAVISAVVSAVISAVVSAVIAAVVSAVISADLAHPTARRRRGRRVAPCRAATARHSAVSSPTSPRAPTAARPSRSPPRTPQPRVALRAGLARGRAGRGSWRAIRGRTTARRRRQLWCPRRRGRSPRAALCPRGARSTEIGPRSSGVSAEPTCRVWAARAPRPRSVRRLTRRRRGRPTSRRGPWALAAGRSGGAALPDRRRGARGACRLISRRRAARVMRGERASVGGPTRG